MNWIVLFYFIYLGVPLALLVFFGVYRPKLAPLTLLICPIVIFLACYRDVLYDASQRGTLLMIAIHTTLVAVPAFIIRTKAKSKEEQ